MSTLDVTEAAAMLKMKPAVLTRWARAGKVPAAKPGRAWVFVEDDLLAWIRGQYKQERTCPSLDAQARPSGTPSSRSAERQLHVLLAPPTNGKPGSTTTASRPTSGHRRGLDMSLLTPGQKPASAGSESTTTSVP